MARRSKLSDVMIRALDETTGLRASQMPESLARAVVELSESFTRDRKTLTNAYCDDPRLLSAYLAYYLPVNLAKVQALLEEMPAPAHPSSDAEQPFRVLDIGGGPGTAALAVFDWILERPDLRPRSVEVISLDRSASTLREAERLWKAYAGMNAVGNFRLVTFQGDATRRSDRRRLLAGTGGVGGSFYDLIVIANTLNELFQTDRDPIKRRAALLEELLDRLDRHGTMMIVEPALRETSRDLHRLRDRLVAERACTVYSPCLHEGPCPALVKEEDWCHEERPWVPPPIVAAIDREVGFIKDALKFSYLLLRKDGASLAQRAPDVYRVVSELRTMKGEQRAWLCNETGRPEVGRLDRQRSPANAVMDDWHRGAIVRIDQIIRKNRDGLGRIPADATVEILRSV
jgi:ribosomal protein RSM22 (predicted rRNA methylase)